MSYDKDARISTLPQYMKYLDSILDDDLDRIISRLNNQPKLRVGTDCSGIDAPIHALKLMNVPFQYEFASDIDKAAKTSINCNHQPRMFFDDIMTRDHTRLPKLDLYCAGFPCQSFSTLGKRQGFDDTKNRGTVFFHCYETIKNTQPKMFVLENVKGLLSHDKGKTFKTIMDYLSRLKGYFIHY